MNINYIGFGRMAEGVLSGEKDRNQIIAAAVATVAARLLPLPSSPIPDEQLDEHYIRNHFNAVSNCVSDVNEGVILDTRFALDLTRKLWCTRVQATHPARYLEITDGYFTGFFGANASLAPENIHFLEKYRNEIGKLANFLNASVEDYFKPTTE